MAEAFKTWQCRTCGYIYEEEFGDPPEGLAPGTRWADIPARNWRNSRPAPRARSSHRAASRRATGRRGPGPRKAAGWPGATSP